MRLLTRESKIPAGKTLWADSWRRLKRNKPAVVGLVVVLLVLFVGVFADLIAPASPTGQDLRARFARPGSPSNITRNGTYILGADQFGRDILSRIIYGARVSLTLAIVVEAITRVIGITVGSVAGYYGGWMDIAISRVLEVLMAFPDLLFYIGIRFALGSSLPVLILAFSAFGWAGTSRFVRGLVMQLKESEYVEAARAQGFSSTRIIVRHILPNCLGPLIVSITLSIPGTIMGEAGLAFLGLGIQPPAPSWGNMIYDSRAYLRVAPFFAIWPGIALIVTVLAFNLFGDGLRDALDPRLKR
ncbi:MAG: ABC transporter permease [Clostridia bacterium]